jgi:hypothetical protein
VPLTGADCFLRAFDAEIRRWNGAGHVSQLVLRLGPGFDVGRFEKLLAEVVRSQPILRAPIRRRLGLGAPAYRLDAAARCRAPRVEARDAELAGPGLPPLPACFAARLNRRMDGRRGELLRFDVVRYAGGAAGTDLAASWLHMLLDGAGSEHFVRWLDACQRGAQRPDALPVADELAAAPGPRPRLRERGRGAMAWQRWLDGFAADPPRSPAGPLRRVPQALGYEVLRLSPEESERAAAAARRRAGFLTPMLFYLAAALRAHHAVFRARGRVPGAYLVPLPVNLRPKGGEGAIFRTHVSLLWFHVPAREADDFDALLRRLKEQRHAAIRQGQVENGAWAMDFARFAPQRLYAQMARRGFGGELCSFFFAYTGEFLPGLEHFLGAEILDGFHVPAVPASPGSCLALSFRGGRLGVTHVHQEGVFSAGELEILREQLRADLLA